MCALVVQYQPNRPGPNLRRKFVRRLAHDGSLFSRVGASDNPGAVQIVDFEKGIRKCLTYPDQIPDKTYVAFLSLAYNIGQAGFCRSSVARYANQKQLTRACHRIRAFNKADGRILRGLVRRRAEEHKLCLEGIREGVVTGIVEGDDARVSQ